MPSAKEHGIPVKSREVARSAKVGKCGPQFYRGFEREVASISTTLLFLFMRTTYYLATLPTPSDPNRQ